MKKISAILLAIVMMLSMVAMADEVPTTGSITIQNAVVGKTYSIYKLFSATVTGTEDGSIAFTGDIPETLKPYFEKDSAGNISATEAAKKSETELSDAAVAALTAWAKDATATDSKQASGTALVFSGIEFGYYVITTDNGTAITVDSTNPNVTVFDKNSSTPISEFSKTVSTDDGNDAEDNVSVGDTVTYTVTFKTANYDGTKLITAYTISDSLPNFLSDVTITEIKIGDTLYKTVDSDDDGVADAYEQFGDDKAITIPWAKDKAPLYAYGTVVTITYTATVNDQIAIGKDAQNTNTVTVDYTTEDGQSGSEQTTTENIYTYAIAIQKVDQVGNPLKDATFQFPFYVNATAAEDGSYVYAGTEEKDGLTNTLTTPETGLIVIKGVEAGAYSITETEAPDGYNKLTTAVEVTAQQMSSATTTTTTYLDANGNVSDTKTETEVIYTSNTIPAAQKVVVNKTGSELPSTGGIGTTIFYTVGGLMMAAAIVLLVAKKKVAASK